MSKPNESLDPTRKLISEEPPLLKTLKSLDEEEASKVRKGLLNYLRERDYQRTQIIEELRSWANNHTHW